MKVQKLNLGWLFKKGKQDYLNLVRILNSGSKHTELFATDFVDMLLKQFWLDHYTKLLWTMFIPYLFYLCFAIGFMFLNLYNLTKAQDPYE